MTKYYAVSEEQLTAIADSIRAKTGSTEGMEVDAMPAEVAGIEGGGNTDIEDRLLTHSGLTTYKNDSVTTLGEAAFCSFPDLERLDLPNVTWAADACVAKCEKLARLNMPSLAEIDGEGFYNNPSLAQVNAPLLKNVGSSVFYASALSEISFLALETVGNYFAGNCHSLIEVDLPKLKSAGNGTFGGCSSLQEISLPNLETVGDQFAIESTALVDVELPNLVQAGSSFCATCPSLTRLNLPVLQEVGTGFLTGCSRLSELSLPALKVLGNNAFRDCAALTRLELPALLRIPFTVGASTYASRYAIEYISCPAATIMAQYALRYMTSLKEAKLPAVDTLDGTYCFGGCSSLSKVDIAALSIPANTFNGCSALKTLILRSATVCTLSATSAFTNTPIKSGTGYIYVPSSLVDTYKAATNWSTYADQIRAIEDYPDITGG